VACDIAGIKVDYAATTSCGWTTWIAGIELIERRLELAEA